MYELLRRVWRSSFGINFPNPSAPCLHVRRLFLFTAFQPLLVIYLHTVVLQTLKLWSWIFFTFLSCRIITHMLTTFSITFLTHLNQKKTAIYVWTPVHLYRSDLFNSLEISVTEWLEDRKNRCLSVSRNSASLHFRERVQKIKKKPAKKKKRKENGKSTKWAGRIWREKKLGFWTHGLLNQSPFGLEE